MSYEAARRREILRLRAQNEAGGIEQGVLLDMETGQRLASRQGDKTSIRFTAGDFHQARRVALVHTHPDFMPPGDDDWNAIVNFPELAEITAIGLGSEFSLRKPENWVLPFSAQHLWDARKPPHEQIIAGEMFNDAVFENLRARIAVEGVPSETEEDLWVAEAARVANRKLSAQLGIIFSEVSYE